MTKNGYVNELKNGWDYLVLFPFLFQVNNLLKILQRVWRAIEKRFSSIPPMNPKQKENPSEKELPLSPPSIHSLNQVRCSNPLDDKRTLMIIRVKTDVEGTAGMLYTRGFSCFTLELPWYDNVPFISCVPQGQYYAYTDDSFHIGGLPVIKLINVPNRTGILIHVANYAGDTDAGYKSEVKGCIAVGYGYDDDEKQRMVYDSRGAMEALLEVVKDIDLFEVVITDYYIKIEEV